MKPFKKEFTLDERLQESAAMIANYPARVPVIVEKFSRSNLPAMEKRKYLVPCDIPVASLIGSVYDSYKDDDGFLYMCYSSEKTFG